MSSTQKEFVVYCADIGSEREENDSHFAWVSKDTIGGTTLKGLAESIFNKIKDNPSIIIAIGFECPLYFDLQDDSTKVTQGRKFGKEISEGDRPWSGGPGANVLVTGLAQTTWLFNYLHNKLIKENIELPKMSIMDTWNEFVTAKSGIFIWEAFISKADKSKNPDEKERHIEDAKKGVDAFENEYNNDAKEPEDEDTKEYFSIIGSVLLRTGWQIDKEHLKRKCIVIPPRKK